MKHDETIQNCKCHELLISWKSQAEASLPLQILGERAAVNLHSATRGIFDVLWWGVRCSMHFCTSCPSGVVFQAWMTGWNPTDFLRTTSWPSWLARWIKLPTYNFICHEMYHCTWHCFMYLSESTWPLGTLCVYLFWNDISISFNFTQFLYVSLSQPGGIQMNSHSPPSFPAKLWRLPCLVHSPRWSAWSSEGLQHDTTTLDVHTFTMGMCLRLQHL